MKKNSKYFGQYDHSAHTQFYYCILVHTKLNKVLLFFSLKKA
jgi:hypothetical protein